MSHRFIFPNHYGFVMLVTDCDNIKVKIIRTDWARAQVNPNSGHFCLAASTDDPEDEISPYCETVFQTRRHPHATEVRPPPLLPLTGRDAPLTLTGLIKCAALIIYVQSERSRHEGREARKEEKHAQDHG